MFCIVFNSILMALQDYAPDVDCPDPSAGKKCPDLQKMIYYFEFVFLAIYILECVLKVLALTIVGYFDNSWNRLDFVVVVLGIVEVASSSGNLACLRPVRLLRTMRTLNIVPSMKRVAVALLESLPLLKNVLYLCIFMLVVFTVFGLQLFRGVFRQQCVVPDNIDTIVADGSPAWTTYEYYDGDADKVFCNKVGEPCGYQTVSKTVVGNTCSAGDESCYTEQKMGYCHKFTKRKVNGIYVNPDGGHTHYDDFGYAFLTVFLLTTAEGWTTIMYWNMDATNNYCVIYYLLVIWIGALITISLVLAALEAAWADHEDEEEDEEEEAENGLGRKVPWVARKVGDVFDYIVSMEKKVNFNQTEVGLTCKWFINTPFFDWLVSYAIVTNTIVLALDRAGMSKAQRDDLEWASTFFLWFFLCEAVLKITGKGMFVEGGYFRDPLDRFDFFVVFISVIEKYAVSAGGGLAVFRALRLLRVLKLVRSWKSLRRLVTAMANSLRAATSLTLVLILLMYIFALVGMQFFAYELPDYSERYNYDTFGWALMSVFVVLSGENWNSLMWDVMSNVHPAWSIYFVLIMILGGYVILNLFIAIVLDELMEARDDEFDEPRTRDENEKMAWVEKTYRRMFKKPMAGREAEEALPSSAVNVGTPTEVPGLVVPEGGVNPHEGKTREQLLYTVFKEYDRNNNDYIEEKEVKELLKFFNIELTMLEYHVMFADDRFTWEEFLDLMNKHKIEISDTMVVTSRGETGARGNFTSAEKAILDEYDIDASLIVPPEMKISDDITLDAGSKSFFIFSEQTRIRDSCIKLAESPRFNNFILLCIIASTICVALDEPGRSCDFQKTLNVLDVIFTIIFTVEMVIKSIAMGFILNKNSYLRSSHFNKLDFIVVVMALITMFLQDGPICAVGGSDEEKIGAFKALRAFRALRPLRTVGRVENLKVVVNALMQSALPIFNVLALMSFFFLIFAILGVQFFAGKFDYCRELSTTPNFNIATVTGIQQCPEISSFEEGLCAHGQCRVKTDCYSCYKTDTGVNTYYERRPDVFQQNFDNVINGFVVLFEMSTLEAWPSIALQGVDSVTSMQDVENNDPVWPNTQADNSPQNPEAFIYFVVFILIGTFFVANLFASVACDKYENMSQFYSGMLFLTEEQKVWVVDSKQVWAAAPKKYSPVPMVPELESIVMAEWFNNLMMSFIVLNVLVMSIEFEDMSDSYEDAMSYLNIVFVVIFALELVLKVLGIGPEAYLADGFNVFDGILVVTSLVTLAADTTVASALRIFRVVRILKLIPKAEKLMSIVMTVYHSLPALFNVGLLTALFFLIFACLGVSLFGEVVYGEQLSNRANFETFGYAMLTLFRIATGEDWNGMMYDLRIQPNRLNGAGAECTNQRQDDGSCPAGYPTPCGCGIPIAAEIYLIIFNVLAAFVMLNVVVAAILTHFDLAQKATDGLSDRMVEKFKNEWWKLDPMATARIQASEFKTFYLAIDPTFNFSAERAAHKPNPLTVDEHIEQMQRKCEDSGGEFRFSEVLYVVAFEKFGHSLGWTMKARELEHKVNKAKIKLDAEPSKLEKPILPQLTENQLMELSIDELREQLVERGHVRFRNSVIDIESRRKSYSPAKAISPEGSVQ